MSRQQLFLGTELVLLFIGVPTAILYSELQVSSGVIIIAAATYAMIMAAQSATIVFPGTRESGALACYAPGLLRVFGISAEHSVSGLLPDAI